MPRTLVAILVLAAAAAGCSETMTPPTTPTPPTEVATTPAAPDPAPGPAPVPVPPPDPPGPRTARYEVVFRSTWAASTHPTDFPPNAHYSGLIGGTHGAGVTFWREGALATEGIRNMAERGGKAILQSEVMAAIAAGTAEFVLSGDALGDTPGSVRMEFTISRDFPLVTLVTMIAPSPDWFVGVAGLALYDSAAGWTTDTAVSLLPYDAGTDSGATYRSPDVESVPRQPISRITGFPMIYNGTVAPFGTFTFKRIE